MVELVSIHSFLIKRMMAAAEEIFDAVKDSVIAYQREIERLKQENNSLKNTLTYSRNYSRAETSHNESTRAGGLLPGTPGLEFSAVKAQRKVAMVMSHEPLSQASTLSLSEAIKGQEPAKCLTHQPEILQKNEGNVALDKQSPITDQSEPCDDQAGDINSPEVTHVIVNDACIEFTVTEQDVQLSEIHRKNRKKVPRTSLQTQQMTCNICNKSFGNKKCLRMHKVVHQSERPFSCDSCGWSFKLKGHLKEHKRLHTGDYRYRCPECGKGFSRSNLVKLHIKSAHSM